MLTSNNLGQNCDRRARSLGLLAAVCLVMASGCAAERAVRDQTILRKHLVKLYEDQIRDNLVRIKTGRAFVHVNYSKLQGKTRDQVFGKIHAGNQNKEVTGDNNIIIEGPGSNDITVGGEVTLWDEISVSGEPVIGNATVYDAYILFAEQFVKKHPAEDESEHLWKYTYKKEDGTSVTYCVPISEQKTNGNTNGKTNGKPNGANKAYERLIWLTTLDQGKTAKVQEVIIESIIDTHTKTGKLKRFKIELYPESAVAKLVSGVLLSSSSNGQWYRVFKEDKECKSELILLANEDADPLSLKDELAILEYREESKAPPKKEKVTIRGFGLTWGIN